MKSAIFAFAIVLSFNRANKAQSYTQQLGVPAYFGTGTAQNQADWNAIQNSAGAVKLVVADYGSLRGDVSTAKARFTALRNSATHPLVLGYVTTANPVTLVRRTESQVLGPSQDGYWSVADWYATYEGYIDGIFLDIGPYSDSDQTFFNDLYQIITTHRSGRCSPGPRACVMLNATQFPNSWVLNVSDFTTLWELALSYRTQNYVSNFCPSADYSPSCATFQSPSGWYFQNGWRASHIVYNAAPANVQSIICASRGYGSPILYIYDGTSNDYGHLSTLFQQTVNFQNQSSYCGNPATDYCGTYYYDPCGALTGCQPGFWCPAGYSCRDAGGYLDCLQ